MQAIGLVLSCDTCGEPTSEHCLGCLEPTCRRCRPDHWPLLCDACVQDVTTYFMLINQEHRAMRVCREIFGGNVERAG
jgi:hypothetical protein